MNTSAKLSASQKGIAASYIVIGILVLAGLVGAYYLGKQNTPPPENKPIVSESQKPSPATSATQDETANWKTYTDEKIGFKIKYPDNWEYAELKAGDPLRLYFYPKHDDINPRNSNETLAPIELIILSDSRPLECLAEDGKSCLDAKVDGVSAKKYSRKLYHEIVAFKANNLFFELMSPKFDKDSFAPGSYKEYYNSYNFPEEKRKKIFDQILSTFRFD
ncbi:hypothetical protein HYU95_04215 [Candidatus Daviesbacteria bacterium]|nr:hypothetical protein [Candidatus Daviesbacteria bacterium]